MADPTEPKADIRTMSKADYKRYKAETLRQISTDAAQARDQKVLDALATAPDDATRRKILRQFSR